MKKFKIKFPGKKFWLSKTFLISACLAAVLIVGGVFAMTATQKKNLLAKALDNVAEARHYMKHADSENLCVQFFSGTREEPYAQDGKASKQVPFAIINVEATDNSLKDFHQIEGTLKIGEEQLPIVLAKNPYDRNFATDISRLVDVNKPIEITLFITNTNHPTLTLENVMDEGAISWKQALEIAAKKISNKLKKSQGFEVYVKIVHDMAQDAGAFWYVQFICDDGCTHFCVVAPDGAVIGNCSDKCHTTDDCKDSKHKHKT